MGGNIEARRWAFVLLALLCAAWPAANGSAVEERQPASITTLFLRTRHWSDYAEPLAVLQLGQPATTMHYVPGPRADSPPLLLAVGDAAGGLHLLSPSGHLMAQLGTGTPSAITALGSYRLGRNATVLLTGHASGELRLHLLPLPPAAGGHPGAARGYHVGDDDAAASWQPRLPLLEALPPQAMFCGAAPASTPPGGSSQQQQQACTCTAAEAAEAAPIVSIYAASRGSLAAAATAVAVDAVGRLAVLKHGGPTGLGVRVVRQSALEQQPTVLRMSAVTAAVLGSSGVAAQRLTPPPAQQQQQQQQEGAAGPDAGPGAPAFKPCTGLNGSSIVAAAWDATHPSRAYALTDDGRALALVTGGGERGAASGCSVRAAAPLPAGLWQWLEDQQQQQQQQQHRTSLAAVPGYLLAAWGDELAVLNTTACPRSAPRLLLRQPLAGLRERFGLSPAAPQQAAAGSHAAEEAARAPPAALSAAPLLAASQQGRHVALALNATVLALFEVSLPHRAAPRPNSGTLAWMQVLQPLGMVGVAAVVLYRARARRGGGGGGGRGLGGRELLGDPRLREFERLLQNNALSGATAARRHRPPPPPGWGGAGGDDSGSDMDDSHLARPLGGGGGGGSSGRPGSAAAQQPKRGLFGRAREGSNGGGGGGAARERREQAARYRRAAAMAAEDEREMAALRAELAGAGLAGADLAGSTASDEDMGEGFGSDIDAPMLSGGRRGSDELSTLRRRFVDTHL